MPDCTNGASPSTKSAGDHWPIREAATGCANQELTLILRTRTGYVIESGVELRRCGRCRNNKYCFWLAKEANRVTVRIAMGKRKTSLRGRIRHPELVLSLMI